MLNTINEMLNLITTDQELDILIEMETRNISLTSEEEVKTEIDMRKANQLFLEVQQLWK